MSLFPWYGKRRKVIRAGKTDIFYDEPLIDYAKAEARVLASVLERSTGLGGYMMGTPNVKDRHKIKFNGLTLVANGEYRRPREGEYWLTPKNMEIYGPCSKNTEIRDVDIVGVNRVILMVIAQDHLTIDMLLDVMTAQRAITIRCYNEPCTGHIGNLYARRRGDRVDFFHTGNDCAIACYNIKHGVGEFDEEFDPTSVRIISDQLTRREQNAEGKEANEEKSRTSESTEVT